MLVLHRIASVLQKLLTGKDVLVVQIPAALWNRQYEKGRWEYLLQGTPNLGHIVWRIMREYELRGESKPLRILDVGCGNGAVPFFLTKTTVPFTYFGTDVSDTAIEQAKRVFPEGEYERTDMLHPMSRVDAVDVLIFNEVLYYGDCLQTLRAHKSLLAEGGIVVVSMYRTLRTRCLWWRLRSLMRFDERYAVFDASRGVTWDIAVCRYT